MVDDDDDYIKVDDDDDDDLYHDYDFLQGFFHIKKRVCFVFESCHVVIVSSVFQCNLRCADISVAGS